jgi:hypothetical protein
MDVSRHLSSYPVQNSPSARVRIVRTYMYNTPTSTNGSMITALSCLALAAVTPALTLRGASHHSEIWRVTSCRVLALPRSFARPPFLSRGQIHVGCIKERSQVWHNTCFPDRDIQNPG